MNNRLLKTASISTILLLSGCGEEKGHSDLEALIEEKKTLYSNGIEPLPPVTKYEGYQYTSGSRRGPFDAISFNPIIDLSIKKSNVKPDFDREKEALEAFHVDALTMNGLLGRNGNKSKAILKDPNGKYHRVQIGNYLGKNHGKIVNIDETGIHIVEIVKTGEDQWEERARSMALRDAGKSLLRIEPSGISAEPKEGENPNKAQRKEAQDR